MEMQKFTEKDWSAFCGCCEWPDGKEPLICIDVLETAEEFVMVLDPTGACVLIENSPINEYGGWILDLPFPTQEAAMAFGTGMPLPKDIDDFLRLGFKEA